MHETRLCDCLILLRWLSSLQLEAINTEATLEWDHRPLLTLYVADAYTAQDVWVAWLKSPIESQLKARLRVFVRSRLYVDSIVCV